MGVTDPPPLPPLPPPQYVCTLRPLCGPDDARVQNWQLHGGAGGLYRNDDNHDPEMEALRVELAAESQRSKADARSLTAGLVFVARLAENRGRRAIAYREGAERASLRRHAARGRARSHLAGVQTNESCARLSFEHHEERKRADIEATAAGAGAGVEATIAAADAPAPSKVTEETRKGEEGRGVAVVAVAAAAEPEGAWARVRRRWCAAEEAARGRVGAAEVCKRQALVERSAVFPDRLLLGEESGAKRPMW